MTRIADFLHHHVICTFLLMGLASGVFGLASFNLIYLFKANLMLFLDYGTMVIGDGAGQQLAELIVNGYLGLAAYLVFKVCEHALVERTLVKRASSEFKD
ncbi:MAG: hypothetical protein ABSF50_20830 [Burkholderiaceae bacterium]|jgi:hypothetical protein